MICRLSALLCVLVVFAETAHAQSSQPSSASASVILNESSYWRSFVVHADPEEIRNGQPTTAPAGRGGRFGWNTPLAPDNWSAPEFDDSTWYRSPRGRYPGYGFLMPDSVSVIHVRGKFNVTDAAAVRKLTLSLTYRGGVAVYINGKELARAHLPAGPLTAKTPAEVYPLSCYVHPDENKAILWGWGEPQKYKDRCDARIRSLSGLEGRGYSITDGFAVLKWNVAGGFEYV